MFTGYNILDILIGIGVYIIFGDILLFIYIECVFVIKVLQHNLCLVCMFQALHKVNAIRHASEPKLLNNDFKELVDILVCLLKDKGFLNADRYAADAVKEIKMVNVNFIYVMKINYI